MKASTEDKFNRVIEAISVGKSVTEALIDERGKRIMGKESFYKLIRPNDNDDQKAKELKAKRRDIYARACDDRADSFEERILDIAFDTSDDELRKKEVKNADGSKMTLREENKEFTNSKRLMIDSLKWLMAKQKPKKYGDRIDVNPDEGGRISIKIDLSKSEDEDEE